MVRSWRLAPLRRSSQAVREVSLVAFFLVGVDAAFGSMLIDLVDLVELVFLVFLVFPFPISEETGSPMEG